MSRSNGLPDRGVDGAPQGSLEIRPALVEICRAHEKGFARLPVKDSHVEGRDGTSLHTG